MGLKESMGFGLEGTSVTLDQLTSHAPRGPRTNLIQRSKWTSPSIPSEQTGESSAPIRVFSIPRQLSRESWVWELGFAMLGFQESNIICLGFTLSRESWVWASSSADSLRALGSLQRPCTTAAAKDLEAWISDPGRSFGGRLMARFPGVKAFFKWLIKPLHPLPSLPSGTTKKPFRRPSKSLEIIRKEPWALEPNCRIYTVSPSLTVRAKCLGDSK